MTVYQVYEKAIKPLSIGEKLTLARLIINDIAPDAAVPDTPQTEMGFDRLKRLLPQIERINVTDHDLAGVVLNGPER